ncbi:MAG: DNA polymerase III subunit alpha [candidate division Zixibacteria bacterium]|nr:DNA polymerase III subunit alpha [Candidatus Tariuqbacter arcticus]
MDFIHLHNHSDYSLLDGAIKVEALLERVKELGMSSVALTDHGNMFGAINFYLKAMEIGVKPIIGIETYLSADDNLPFEGGQPLLYHLVLLVKNKQGYQNLINLSSKAFIEGFYYRARITRQWLRQYSEGLLCLSACAKGEVAYHILQDNIEAARDAALFYQEIFGDDFYLEAQNHGLPDEEKVLMEIFPLAEELGIKMVATNDCHYLLKEHTKSHDILLCIQTGKSIDDKNRLKYETEDLYVRSQQEMSEVFSDHPEVLENTLEVADKCDLELEFDTMHLPEFPLPPGSGAENVHQFLEMNVNQGVARRFGESPPEEIRQRIEYELGVIKDMGFSGYFLIVKDFIDFARSREIAVGPARGSAAGSLVSYCLCITDIDPLRYGLLFERFLNPERVTMPDIDIDFADDRRDEVISYVREKYGESNVTQIITFGKMMARAVVRDVGRVMEIPYNEVDKIAKLIPYLPGMTLERAFKESPDLKTLVDSNPQYQEMMKHCRVLEGLNRHSGTHAAGVVITPTKLTDFTPLFKSRDGEITSQYDMNGLEAIGLLKIDFLGLKTLTIITNTLKLLAKKGIKLNINDIPLNDEQTFRLFQEGKTVGIFQFESLKMREYLQKLKPARLDDLIAMNALYRPGPIKFIDDFIKRKHGQQKIRYLHANLEPILQETYGIIVYQEQVIRLANEIAGFSMGKSDRLRRAMGKKVPAEMQAMKKDFIQGIINNGLKEYIGKEIFDLVDKFAEYGFNKSHSAGYALVAYQTAYLKAHYPAEFMAATMTSEMGRDSSRFMILVTECAEMGVNVLPPDINESGWDFTITEKGIRFGLGAVKNVGENPVKSIIDAREKAGGFTDIYQFIEEVDLRLVNRRAMESMIQVGAFDSIEPNRARLFASIDSIIAYGNAISDDRQKGQISMFDIANDAQMVFPQPELPQVQEWSQTDRLSREKELLGFYVSGHPLEKFRKQVESCSNPPIERLEAKSDGAPVRLCGIITSVKRKLTKKGDMMAIATLEDFTGSTEVLFFKDELERSSALLVPDQMVTLTGRVSTREDEPVKIRAEKLIPLEQARAAFTRSLQIEIDTSQLETGKLAKLEKLFAASPGDAQVIFTVNSAGNIIKLKSAKYTVSTENEFINDLGDLLGANCVKLGK